MNFIIMNSNELEQLVQQSVEKQEDLETKLNRHNQRVREFENADIEERNTNRIVNSVIPYLCSAVAAVGLSRAGIMDPNYAGVLAVGASAVVGSIIESKKVRKVVSSRTLDMKSTTILRDRVYYAIEAEKVNQELIRESAKAHELERVMDGGSPLDIYSPEVERQEFESMLHDLAVEKGLKEQIPESDDKTKSELIGIGKTIQNSAILFGANAVAIGAAGGNSPEALFVVPAIYGLSSLAFHLTKEKDKRKIDKRYRVFTSKKFEDMSLFEIECLSKAYAERLGKLDATMLLQPNAPQEEVDEEPSLFMEVWEEEARKKDVKTLSKEKR